MAGQHKRQLIDEIEISFNEQILRVQMQAVLIEKATQSKKAAKNWLRVADENWELGIGEVKPLLDAYERYFKLSSARIKEEKGYHLALATLAYQKGNVRQYLEWLKRESITLY